MSSRISLLISKLEIKSSKLLIRLILKMSLVWLKIESKLWLADLVG